MSGGTWDYQEYHIRDIAESIRNKIINDRDPKWVERKKNECSWYHPYSEETLKQFEEAYKILYKAAIYATRVDYLEAGDDGEDTFKERTADELAKADAWFNICFEPGTRTSTDDED